MTSSLVGSEMCIRDSPQVSSNTRTFIFPGRGFQQHEGGLVVNVLHCRSCLLYTSDAADDM
eukprot:4957218-Prorocentrum_lima.AAC.1